jgi:chloramphenicol-sensitive protein RarD
MQKGILYAVGAYVAWGLFPVYFKWLQHVPGLQVVSHRILWSCAMLVGVILLRRQWRIFRSAALAPRVLRLYAGAAILISINWLMFVWAVNNGFIVEVSLGYFINPIVSVLLGVVFLRERLRSRQWIPVGLAAAGVLTLTVAHGSLPWIALTLACSFGLYGLVKKIAPLGSFYGLTVETGILLVPALMCLLYARGLGDDAFLRTGVMTDFLLIGSGAITAIPLLLFASATQRIPLSLIGILQYIAPTLQFFVGVLIYHEPFTHAQCIGFSIVWVALILFAIDGLLARRMNPAETL